MTDGTTATIDLKDMFSKEELTLENYRRFREVALLNEANTKALSDLADALEPTNAKNATKKGIALWLLGKTKAALAALEKAHPDDETAAAFLGRALVEEEQYE